MRINKNKLSAHKKKNNNSRPRATSDSSSPQFQNDLQQAQKQQLQERFDRLMKIVDKKGEKLKETLDKKDLLEYKERVREFLKLIQKEFVQAKQAYSWDGSGDFKTYTVIEKIDRNLEILHNQFLKEQSDTLKIVSKIDEIRGLMMDLYR